MTVFRKKAGWGATLAAGFVVSGLLVGCQPQKPELDPMEGYRVAVVDMLPLMEVHPDYSKLQQLETEISELQREKLKIEGEAREAIINEAGETMAKAVQEAKAKLEAEQKRIQDELAGLSAGMAAQLEREMLALQSANEAELKQMIAGLTPQAAEPPPPIEAGVEGQVKDYMENLMLVRERNLAAKRLELEKRVGDKIAAKKAEVQGQIAAYEADLSAQYQGERLNLQLTAQNSTDEEAKTAAENRLAEIAADIGEKKAAKEAELQGTYAAVRAEETAAIQGELQAYQAELQAEINQKIARKRAEIGGLPIPQPRPATQGPPPELTSKIAEIEARMKGQLASKQAQLKATMNARIAKAEEEMRAKQEEIEKSLKALEAEMDKKVQEGLANLPEETKKKMEEVEQKIEQMTEERKKLVEAMRTDVSGKVAGIAEEQEQKMVLGVTMERDYFYMDESFKDLTERSQVRMQTTEKK